MLCIGPGYDAGHFRGLPGIISNSLVDIVNFGVHDFVDSRTEKSCEICLRCRMQLMVNRVPDRRAAFTSIPSGILVHGLPPAFTVLIK